jgi:hypothetical protein
LRVLGYIVSAGGIAPDPAKVAAVQRFPVPILVKQLQSFIGFCSYYRRFIKRFAILARPLITLTKHDQPFQWEGSTTKLWRPERKTLNSSYSVPSEYQLPFEIHTDASGYGIGAILVEQHEEGERAISYVSRLLSSAKLNYSVSEKERSTLMSMRTPFVG